MQNKKHVLGKLSRLIVLITLIFPLAANAQTLFSVEESEARVRDYFADLPAMIDIAKCESGFRQYTDSGNVFYGGAGGKMIGIFQLHGDYHLAAAQNIGLDITTVDGNLAYSRHLYEKEGLAPWGPCLGAVGESSLKADASQNISSSISESDRAKLVKRIEELQMQVYRLQIQLLKMQLAALSASQQL